MFRQKMFICNGAWIYELIYTVRLQSFYKFFIHVSDNNKYFKLSFEKPHEMAS